MHLLFCAHLINIFTFVRVLNLDIFSIRNAQGCLVCVCNLQHQHFLFLYHQSLHNDCSYIEDVHPIICVHFMNFVFIFGVLNLDVFFCKMLRGCLVFVICNFKSSHSLIFKLCKMIIRTFKNTGFTFIVRNLPKRIHSYCYILSSKAFLAN